MRIARYSRWEDAMIAQARLLSFSYSDFGLRYLHAFFRSENSQHKPEFHRDPALLTVLQQQMLERAEPTYATAHSCDLVDYARETWTLEVPHPADPWTPHGFVLFEKPISLKDPPPTEGMPHRSPTGSVPVRAVAWTSTGAEDPTVGAFWIGFYVSVDDELDLAAERGIHDHRYDDPAYLAHMRSEFPLALGHQWQWQWGRDIHDEVMEVKPVEGLTEEQARQYAYEQSAFVQTLWRIGSQFVPIAERAPRSLRRDAVRRGIIHTEHVNVIRLRRSKPSKELTETGRTLGVQHPVRGYWRWQNYRDGRRQRWIVGYIRGSDDLPWKDGSLRAYEFNR